MGMTGTEIPQRRQRLSRAHGSRLEGARWVRKQASTASRRLVHQMNAINNQHRVGGPLANTIRIQGTAIATDHGDRRMLGELGGDGCRRALRQQADDVVTRQINQHGTIPMAPPPGLLVDADGLGGCHNIP
jgi:hypothetical protein